MLASTKPGVKARTFCVAHPPQDLETERDDLAADKKELEQANHHLERERDSLERRLTLLCDGKTREGKIIGEVDVSTWMMRARQMKEHTDIVQSVCACRGYLVSSGCDRTIKVGARAVVCSCDGRCTVVLYAVLDLPATGIGCCNLLGVDAGVLWLHWLLQYHVYCRLSPLEQFPQACYCTPCMATSPKPWLLTGL